MYGKECPELKGPKDTLSHCQSTHIHILQVVSTPKPSTTIIAVPSNLVATITTIRLTIPRAVYPAQAILLGFRILDPAPT